MSVPMDKPRSRKIVTLTTDFGLRDAYAAVMKAAVLRQCGQALLIDVTHQVPPQDILCGSITLERAVDGFPAGTVHLAVVDPGVGTRRRMLICELKDQFIVCPDNGLITWSWRRHTGGAAHEIQWRPAIAPSRTFHGRDIFGPVAGMLAAGRKIAELASPIKNPVLLELAPVEDAGNGGVIIHLDHYGNATTNIGHERIGSKSALTVRLKRHKLGSVRKTYCDVPPGEPLALIGSSGLLEIAVRDGSAANALRLKVGDEVHLT
jgi:S-adenosyl-L-methionine hydrolase (adenosine-forming)